MWVMCVCMCVRNNKEKCHVTVFVCVCLSNMAPYFMSSFLIMHTFWRPSKPLRLDKIEELCGALLGKWQVKPPSVLGSSLRIF